MRWKWFCTSQKWHHDIAPLSYMLDIALYTIWMGLIMTEHCYKVMDISPTCMVHGHCSNQLLVVLDKCCRCPAEVAGNVQCNVLFSLWILVIYPMDSIIHPFIAVGPGKFAGTVSICSVFLLVTKLHSSISGKCCMLVSFVAIIALQYWQLLNLDYTVCSFLFILVAKNVTLLFSYSICMCMFPYMH